MSQAPGGCLKSSSTIASLGLLSLPLAIGSQSDLFNTVVRIVSLRGRFALRVAVIRLLRHCVAVLVIVITVRVCIGCCHYHGWLLLPHPLPLLCWGWIWLRGALLVLRFDPVVIVAPLVPHVRSGLGSTSCSSLLVTLILFILLFFCLLLLFGSLWLWFGLFLVLLLIASWSHCLLNAIVFVIEPCKVGIAARLISLIAFHRNQVIALLLRRTLLCFLLTSLSFGFGRLFRLICADDISLLNTIIFITVSSIFSRCSSINVRTSLHWIVILVGQDAICGLFGLILLLLFRRR